MRRFKDLSQHEITWQVIDVAPWPLWKWYMLLRLHSLRWDGLQLLGPCEKDGHSSDWPWAAKKSSTRHCDVIIYRVCDCGRGAFVRPTLSPRFCSRLSCGTQRKDVKESEPGLELLTYFLPISYFCQQFFMRPWIYKLYKVGRKSNTYC